MKELPKIFKPGINKPLNNNTKVYYSNLKEEERCYDITNKENIKKYVLANNVFNKEVIIETNEGNYTTKIVDRMGNNIITKEGKIINIHNIIGIYNP